MKVVSKTIFCAFIAVALLTTKSPAEVVVSDGIYLGAEFRPRIEFDGRDFSNRTGYDAYATSRTRIGLKLDNLIENTEIYLMIGDSRTMGYSNPYLTGEPVGPNRFDNNLGVIKAYVEVRDIFGDGYYLKIGRISNDLGRSLLFGPGNWNLYGPRTYDGIKTGYRGADLSLNIWNFFGASGDRHWYPLDDNPAISPNQSIDYKRDHTLIGMDMSIFDRKINLLMYMDLDQKPVADTLHGGSNVAFNRTTSAVNLHFERDARFKHWFDFDLAYQFGTMAHGAGRGTISAYQLAGDWRCRFNQRMNPWLGLGFHVLSGDNGESPDRITYFYDKYCSKHRVFGNMDYFKSDVGIKSFGLQDFILRAGFNPLKGLSCKIDLHHFAVQKPFPSEVDGASAYTLGQELDATVKYAIRKGLKAELGIDLFWPTKDWQGSGRDLSTFVFMVLTAKL